jgi:hypothetical protein
MGANTSVITPARSAGRGLCVWAERVRVGSDMDAPRRDGIWKPEGRSRWASVGCFAADGRKEETLDSSRFSIGVLVGRTSSAGPGDADEEAAPAAAGCFPLILLAAGERPCSSSAAGTVERVLLRVACRMLVSIEDRNRPFSDFGNGSGDAGGYASRLEPATAAMRTGYLDV